jgi:transcriptional regulator with XRE-family HTH domain
MNIGTAVKTIRKQKKLSQKELADKCEISVNALSQIETNASFPHKGTIKNICDALEIPSSYLLLFAVDDEDIPENKKDIFNSLNRAIKSFLLDDLK